MSLTPKVVLFGLKFHRAAEKCCMTKVMYSRAGVQGLH